MGELMGRTGAIIIVAIMLAIGIMGLAIFGPLVLMFLVPLLLVAGCIWILRHFKRVDSR